MVAAGAASTLARTTTSGRDELRLLQRTSTTRRQLLAMTGVESPITGLTAWALGTAASSAVIGVTPYLLPGHAPLVGLAAYALAATATARTATRATSSGAAT